MKTFKINDKVRLKVKRILDITLKPEIFEKGTVMTVYYVNQNQTVDLVDEQGRRLNEVNPNFLEKR